MRSVQAVHMKLSRAALSRGKLQTIEQYLVVRAVPLDLRVKLLDYFVYRARRRETLTHTCLIEGFHPFGWPSI